MLVDSPPTLFFGGPAPALRRLGDNRFLSRPALMEAPHGIVLHYPGRQVVPMSLQLSCCKLFASEQSSPHLCEGDNSATQFRVCTTLWPLSLRTLPFGSPRLHVLGELCRAPLADGLAMQTSSEVRHDMALQVDFGAFAAMYP